MPCSKTRRSDASASGCHTEINCLLCLLTSMSSDGRTPLPMPPSHITPSRFMALVPSRGDTFTAGKAAHWSICVEYMPMPTKLDNGEVITVLRLLSCSQ
ncbi:hypothetical protein BDR07DRAFT_1345911 [Suillus spraguei]|nr:hypothetical protein BDR07DRAFT_1345911 [Suillus spraguei]